jgi:hypothetical protein
MLLQVAEKCWMWKPTSARHLGGHHWRTNLDRLMCRQ